MRNAGLHKAVEMYQQALDEASFIVFTQQQHSHALLSQKCDSNEVNANTLSNRAAVNLILGMFSLAEQPAFHFHCQQAIIAR